MALGALAVLESAGMTEDDFGAIVVGYRREIWLWLVGERTWAQCCSGLIGRIDRRLGARSPRGVSPPLRAVRRCAASTSAATGGRCSTGVDWEVGRGERWVVLGPNGSGKTTLLRVAGARLWPTAGMVEVLGERLGRVDVRTLRPRVAFVSGAVTRQLARRRHGARGRGERAATARSRPGGTPTRRDGLGRRPTGCSPRPASGRDRGDRSLRGHLRGRAPARPPGPGAHERPELLLLDEPAAGLDLGARERLLVRLGTLAADPASPPMVLVTHHTEEIPPGFTHGGLVRRGSPHRGRPARRGDHVGARVGLLRRAGHGGLRRREVVESRRPGVTHRHEQGRKKALESARRRWYKSRPSGEVPTRSALCISPPSTISKELLNRLFRTRAKVGRRGVAIVILLGLVAVLWVAVLAPSVWRRFSERQGVGSIESFHHQLQLLEHAGPKTCRPAYRLHTALPRRSAPDETPGPGQLTPKFVLLRPTETRRRRTSTTTTGATTSGSASWTGPSRSACPKRVPTCVPSAVSRPAAASACCCGAWAASPSPH